MQTSQSILSTQRHLEQERDEALKALSESESRFRALTEFSPLGIYQTDCAGNYSYSNSRWQEIFWLPEDTTSRADWNRIIHPDDRESVLEEWQRSIQISAEITLDFRILNPADESRHIRILSRPMITGEQKAVGFVAVAEDITTRKQTEEKLQQMLEEAADSHARVQLQALLLKKQNEDLEFAQAKAEVANKSKSEFLANMSHEIRTPLTAILGFADILSDSCDGDISVEETRDCIDTIKRNGVHLLSLINDILDISKIEAGKLFVENITVNPVSIVNEVIELMQVKAQANRVNLKVRLIAPLPPSIKSDPLRLRQILVNIVGNAIKFTENGHVTVRVERDALEPATLVFSVIDDGIGMSDEQMTRLFLAFEQADTSTTRKFGGSGLGLRISQRLAEMLNGSITVQSELGAGSVFTLILNGEAQKKEPRKSPVVFSELIDSSTGGKEPVNSLQGVRVLLAEDNPDNPGNQPVVALCLRMVGAEVSVVNDGAMDH